MERIVILLLVAALGIIMILIPTKVYENLTKYLSFDKTGIRYIRRRRDNVDTLANLFLLVSVLFSILYFLIPFYAVVYVVFLLFSLLCVLAQAHRVLKKKTKVESMIILYGLYLMGAVGLVCATGLLNGHIADMMVSTFRTDLLAGTIFDIFYLLTNHSIMVYILQAILFFIPLYCMWSQFKYMRLENTYKAVHVVTYVIKVVLICVILILLSTKGYDFINLVYQVEYKEA